MIKRRETPTTALKGEKTKSVCWCSLITKLNLANDNTPGNTNNGINIKKDDDDFDMDKESVLALKHSLCPKPAMSTGLPGGKGTVPPWAGLFLYFIK